MGSAGLDIRARESVGGGSGAGAEAMRVRGDAQSPTLRPTDDNDRHVNTLLSVLGSGAPLNS